MNTRTSIKPTLLLLLALAPLGGLSALSACGDGGGGGGTDNTPIDDDQTGTRRAVLGQLGQAVFLNTYADFEQAAEALEQATAAYADDPSQANRDAARAAWNEAMAIWQQAELLQVGPAGLMGEVAGGEDLRDEIYSWPLVNRCRVDQEIVEGNFAQIDAFAAEPVNVRGLDAMEHLLFSEGTDNDCAPNSAINRDGTWDALGAEGITANRARYAHTLAALLVRSAVALSDAWSPESGDFVGQLSRAGLDSQTYRSTQEALNAVSDAMFYIEKETKDMKVAEPIGLTNCDAATCPEALESPTARRSKEHILANLRAFQRLYLGGGPDDHGPGFDDLLTEVGAEALATTMGAEIEAAIAAVQDINGPLEDAITNDPQGVLAAHDALKQLVTTMKTEFVSVLDLEIPQRAEGDND